MINNSKDIKHCLPFLPLPSSQLSFALAKNEQDI